MSWKFEGVQAVSVGTTAKDVKCHFSNFMLQNASEDKTIYIQSGIKATAANGLALYPKDRITTVMTADVISVVASATGADLRIIYVDEA